MKGRKQKGREISVEREQERRRMEWRFRKKKLDELQKVCRTLRKSVKESS